jgi:uncharacterized sporulation protein YeaH/YhbH (DUF444 family)
MSAIIDRRRNDGHKSAVNQQRFLRRYRSLVRDAVARAVTGRKIGEVDRDASISIPSRGLHEPIFSHGPQGRREHVLPGNREYVSGDELQRPGGGGGGGGGGQAGEDGEAEDSFRFHLSREAFLDFFFEDMALPDMAKKHLSAITQTKRVSGGFRTYGSPSNLSVVRTMRGSLARRLASSSTHRARLRRIEEELEELEPDDPRALELLAERKVLRAAILRVPFIDSFDLRYRNRIVQPREIAQAVMFCVMDVSGSMDEARKDLAKRFFILLHLFLMRHYERIEVVFLRHHTRADVVDEEAFFHSTESGGTLVSSALELTLEEIDRRFPLDQWNIYIAQASDGDNWEDDSPRCREILVNKLLPIVQYFAYVEVNDGQPQNLWAQYEEARGLRDNLAMGRVRERADIYPVLRELFAKKGA